MDVDVCVRCGRCEANCPANITGKELTPMGFLKDIKNYMDAYGPKIIEARRQGNFEPLADERIVAGDVVSFNTVWDCVTCGACETQCPVMIEHIGKLQDMRRYMVLTEGNMPPTAQAVLTQLEQRGHPWRGTDSDACAAGWRAWTSRATRARRSTSTGSVAPARWSTATCRSRGRSRGCWPKPGSASAAWVRKRPAAATRPAVLATSTWPRPRSRR